MALCLTGGQRSNIFKYKLMRQLECMSKLGAQIIVDQGYLFGSRRKPGSMREAEKTKLDINCQRERKKECYHCYWE